MKFRNLVLLLTFALLANVTLAAKQLGNSNAPKKGTFKYNLGQAPTTLNALSSTDAYASRVQAYILESLLDRNVDTYEWQPALATKWKISKDGTKYTFTLREGVKWHDGKPLTIEDVKFSFDAIMHPKNLYKTAHMKPYYENISEAKIIDKNTIQFVAKKKYFRNFDTVAGLTVVPRHLYENPSDKMKKKLNKTLVGTGAYVLDKYQRGKKIELKLNKDWWGFEEQKGNNNFNKISMKFIKDETKSVQHLEKGNLDFIGLQPEKYVKNTKGPKWGKKVRKVKVQNKSPQGYSFLGWNNKNILFKDKEIRKAMTHLFNRRLMIKKFNFDMSTLSSGPLYLSSDYADNKVKPLEFDQKKALEILRKNGWKDTDEDGILDKVIDGKKTNFSFTILEPRQEFMKYLTIFKEDAKKAGVEVKLKYVEWQTFIKLLDERKFEAVRLAWSGGAVDWDPKQIWHSASIKGGSNFIQYENPTVDKLIDQARVTLDRKKRIKVLRKVFREIAADAPYLFLWYNTYTLYGHTEKMKRVKDTYNYGVGTNYWWVGK